MNVNTVPYRTVHGTTSIRSLYDLASELDIKWDHYPIHRFYKNCRLRGASEVHLAKKAFGQQQTTKNYSCRNRITITMDCITPSVGVPFLIVWNSYSSISKRLKSITPSS